MTASLPADCFRPWFQATTIGSRYLLFLQLLDVYSTTFISSFAHLQLLPRQSRRQVTMALTTTQAVLLEKLLLE